MGGRRAVDRRGLRSTELIVVVVNEDDDSDRRENNSRLVATMCCAYHISLGKDDRLISRRTILPDERGTVGGCLAGNPE